MENLIIKHMRVNIKFFLFLAVVCFPFQTNAENIFFKRHETISTSRTCSKKWTPLFVNAKDTIHWQSIAEKTFPNDGWQITQDELILLSGNRGGDIITKKRYSNFELKLEFRMTRLVNSGVKYFVLQMKNERNGKIEWIGYEYQIIDDFHQDEIRGFDDDRRSTAALYLLYAPSKKKHLKPLGEWNSLSIKVKNNRIEHWLNGIKVISIKTNIQDFENQVKKTKFVNYKDYHKKNEGHILIQDHGSEIHYRNIQIKEL